MLLGALGLGSVLCLGNHYPRCTGALFAPSAHRDTDLFGGLGLRSSPPIGTDSATGSPRQYLAIQSTAGNGTQGGPFNSAVVVTILDQYLPNGPSQWDAAAVGVPRGDSPDGRLLPTRVCNGGALNCAHVGQVNDQLYLADGRRFCVGWQFNPRSDL